MILPTALVLPQIRDSLRSLNDRIDAWMVGNVNMAGRRLTNCGQSVSDFDYVTRFELDKVSQNIMNVSVGGTTPVPVVGPLNTAGPVRVGTFATRGAPIPHDKEIFIASDLDYIAWASIGGIWRYQYGVRSIAQSQIATFTALLGANDGGVLINVTDFGHMLRWTGAALEFAPGDSGGGYISFFPISPPGGGWGLCDGTTYSYLAADGTTANFVTPDYTTAAYVKAGISATIGPTAASGTTADESAHTHAITNPTSAPSATTTVDNTLGGSTVAVGSATHTHTVTTPTGAGSAHSHGPGTLELRQTLLTAYFRR